MCHTCPHGDCRQDGGPLERRGHNDPRLRWLCARVFRAKYVVLPGRTAASPFVTFVGAPPCAVSFDEDEGCWRERQALTSSEGLTTTQVSSTVDPARGVAVTRRLTRVRALLRVPISAHGHASCSERGGRGELLLRLCALWLASSRSLCLPRQVLTDEPEFRELTIRMEEESDNVIMVVATSNRTGMCTCLASLPIEPLLTTGAALVRAPSASRQDSVRGNDHLGGRSAPRTQRAGMIPRTAARPVCCCTADWVGYAGLRLLLQWFDDETGSFRCLYLMKEKRYVVVRLGRGRACAGAASAGTPHGLSSRSRRSGSSIR